MLINTASKPQTQVCLPSRQPPSGASFPSLPAGINTDDSDPSWGRIEAWNTVPLSGPVGTPLLGGVAIVSLIFLYRHYGIRIIGDKP